MILNIKLPNQLRHRFQHRCPMPVMTRISANEQYVHWSILPNCKLCQLRVVSRKEVLCTTSLLTQRRKNRRKIADNKVIIGERHVSKRSGVPGNYIPYATRKTFDEVRSPT